MRGSAGGLEKLSAGVSGLVKKRLDCTVVCKLCKEDKDRPSLSPIPVAYVCAFVYIYIYMLTKIS